MSDEATAEVLPTVCANKSGGDEAYEFDPSISADERIFYMKTYPNVEMVCDRKIHCTICKTHIGTSLAQEANIKMHPVLRVMQCIKCHDFYNSGEFSKGDDGSELYCRWCGQGGEVYCCSSCPYVFCKRCIMKNLSRGVVADIEQNENWNCFSCTPKILWPLRALHWALVEYIKKQKRELKRDNMSESDYKQAMNKDNSTCCRISKVKSANMSDSMESLDSNSSKRNVSSSNISKKTHKLYSMSNPPAKRAKISNDEVVCTPDLSNVFEPVCQITVSKRPSIASSPKPILPKIASTPTNTNSVNSPQRCSPMNTDPPPLVLRNTSVQVRPITSMSIRRQVITPPRIPSSSQGGNSPVYHNINGFRVDLNSASQQETFRLPNGKLIQVKRQTNPPAPNGNNFPQQQQQQLPQLPMQNTHQQQPAAPSPQLVRPLQIIRTQANYQNVGMQQSIPVGQAHLTHQQHLRPPLSRLSTSQYYTYNNSAPSNTSAPPLSSNGNHIQVVNGTPTAPLQATTPVAIRPTLVKHIFPETAIGQARSQLQDEVFGTMEVTQHLSNKLLTFTNSNAYKQARNYLDVKELYIHLSYVLSYAIARFKGMQEHCLSDMRQLGFSVDADSLESGQLAADKTKNCVNDADIEIVEPKTDTIELDSDDEEEKQADPNQHIETLLPVISSTVTLAHLANLPTFNDDFTMCVVPNPVMSSTPVRLSDENVAINDANDTIQMPSSSNTVAQKKKPRKKTTNKPNPTLIKQRALLEQERLETTRDRDEDTKLKIRCVVKLRRVEKEYPFVEKLLKKSQKKRSNSIPPQKTNKKSKQRIPSHKSDVKSKNAIDDEASSDDVNLAIVKATKANTSATSSQDQKETRNTKDQNKNVSSDCGDMNMGEEKSKDVLEGEAQSNEKRLHDDKDEGNQKVVQESNAGDQDKSVVEGDDKDPQQGGEVDKVTCAVQDDLLAELSIENSHLLESDPLSIKDESTELDPLHVSKVELCEPESHVIHSVESTTDKRGDPQSHTDSSDRVDTLESNTLANINLSNVDEESLIEAIDSPTVLQEISDLITESEKDGPINWIELD